MIRINLLPVRAAKKKETIRFQLTVAGLVTFLVFAVSIAAYLTISSEASNLNDQIAKGNQELEQLKSKIGELSRIKEQKRIVEEKLNIIANLEAARTGPVNMFKKIREAIPEKAWLKSVKDEGLVITLKGVATDDELVADFMRNLQRTKEWLVELDIAETVMDQETNTEVVGFTIRLEKIRPAAPAGGAR